MARPSLASSRTGISSLGGAGSAVCTENAARERTTADGRLGPEGPAGPGPPEPGLEAELGFEAAFFQAVLDGDQEAGGVGAVDQAVVVGEGQVDRGADRDHLAEARSQLA